jgi:hypothetical protein
LVALGFAAQAAPLAPADICAGHELEKKPLTSGDLVFADHFLWKVTSKEGKASYVLGLTHGVPAITARDWNWLFLLLKKSRLYVSEIPLRSADLTELAELQNSTKSIESELSPEFLKRLDQALTERNLRLEEMKTKQPWAIYGPLGTYLERGFIGIDQILYAQAEAFNRPIKPLETVRELEAHFHEAFDRRFHLEVLKDTLCALPLVMEQSKDMVSTFVNQRPLEHVKAGFGLVSRSSNRSEIFRAKLVNDRNKVFAERLGDVLREGGVFATMGALHLVGEEGLLQLLNKKGFSVDPVEPDSLAQELVATADLQPVRDSIEEAARYIQTVSKFNGVDFAKIPVRLMTSRELDQKVCGGANCGAKALYTEDELIVSTSLLSQLTSNSIFAQSVMVHELTHHAQRVNSGLKGQVSCSQWKEWEIEAMTVQSQYLAVYGKTLPISPSHYGAACKSEGP